jgi:hypothetical protein
MHLRLLSLLFIRIGYQNFNIHIVPHSQHILSFILVTLCKLTSIEPNARELDLEDRSQFTSAASFLSCSNFFFQSMISSSDCEYRPSHCLLQAQKDLIGGPTNF